jgi:hypothetical protein
MANFNRFITVFDAVKRAMERLNLGTPTTVIGSTDETIKQFVSLLGETLEELAGQGQWRQLSDDWELTLLPNTTEYTLPEDWNGFTDDTMWNFTNRQPAIGPVPAGIWKALQARSLGSTFTLMYALEGNEVKFLSVPSANQSVKVEYQTRRWVLDANGTTYKDFPEKNDDVLQFPADVVVQWMKFKWRQTKGFDTVAAKNDADTAVMSALGRDKPAPRLSLARRSGMSYVGYKNIPDTGYGS